MKGSTLIKKIQKAINKYGDIRVRIDHDDLRCIRIKKSKSDELNDTNDKFYIDIRVFE